MIGAMGAAGGTSEWDQIDALARAVEGDGAADLPPAAETRGLGAALALRASNQAPPLWRQALRRSTVSWLQIDDAFTVVSRRLDELGIPWMIIKGYDVGQRFYTVREQRPVADLDLLIDPSDLAAARASLERSGWQSLYAGERSEAYQRDEGYCWPAVGRGGAMVELHFRLWGLVGENVSREIMKRGRPEPIEAGSYRRQIRPEDAFLIAAVHTWLGPRPRSLSSFRDLHLIVGNANAEEIVERACDWDLQLPVSLSCAVVNRLWQDDRIDEIERRLRRHLRWPERGLLKRLARSGPDGVRLGGLVLRRLLACRTSRAGARSIRRSLWPHAGVVERETPGHWPWIKRRLSYQSRRWHLAKKH